MTTITVGEKELNLLANAATPIRYKMVFSSDLMVEFNQLNTGKKDGGEMLEITTQLAFIMNRQADCDKKELSALSKDSYVEWLEDFGAMDFVNASEAIINTYLGTTGTTSKSKNVESRPKGK